MMNFPHQPDQLTAAWLTDTLRRAEVLKNARVVSFAARSFAETAGLLGQNMIIRLAYDTPEDTAPPSIFAKFAPADADKRAGWRTSYVQEVRFYQQFAQQVALPTPRAYFAEFDEETGHFLLLLEDCSHGEAGDRLTGCSLDRARQAVAEIATFHATWWQHPDVPHYSGKYTHDAALTWQALYSGAVERLDDIAEIPRDRELVRTIKELAPQLANSMDYQRSGPYTLIHHDYHLGNLIFVDTSDGPKVLVIDWQDLSVGHGPTDIAMLLGNSFSIDERRKYEQALLTLYHNTLVEHGVTNYSFEQCWDDYRLGMFELLWRDVILFGNGYLQGAAYTEHLEVYGPRAYAAVVDLKSREALSRLGTTLADTVFAG